jgi:hypothetical protein
VGGFPVVPAGEVFFQANIEADEEVAAAHFFDFEFGGAGAAVAPGDGDGGETEAADDGAVEAESSVGVRADLVSGGAGIFYEMLGIRRAPGIPPSVVANWALWA